VDKPTISPDIPRISQQIRLSLSIESVTKANALARAYARTRVLVSKFVAAGIDSQSCAVVQRLVPPRDVKKLSVIFFGLLCAAAAVAQTGFVPEKTAPQIARAAFPSVVLLAMQDARGQPVSAGSGFFVDKDIVATNFHVIDGFF
jgi:S1-C subfamily serine protease